VRELVELKRRKKARRWQTWIGQATTLTGANAWREESCAALESIAGEKTAAEASPPAQTCASDHTTDHGCRPRHSSRPTSKDDHQGLLPKSLVNLCTEAADAQTSLRAKRGAETMAHGGERSPEDQKQQEHTDVGIDGAMTWLAEQVDQPGAQEAKLVLREVQLSHHPLPQFSQILPVVVVVVVVVVVAAAVAAVAVAVAVAVVFAVVAVAAAAVAALVADTALCSELKLASPPLLRPLPLPCSMDPQSREIAGKDHRGR